MDIRVLLVTFLLSHIGGHRPAVHEPESPHRSRGAAVLFAGGPEERQGSLSIPVREPKSSVRDEGLH